MTDMSTIMPSPVGTLRLVATDTALVAVLWAEEPAGRVPVDAHETGADHPILRETRRQLQDYFAGHRRTFDLPLDFRGTAFQRRVWSALLTIPYGETRSYGEIARAIGRPAAVRAVARACATNPVALVVPCHRVVPQSARTASAVVAPAPTATGGYRWGTRVKAALLARERRSPR